MAGKILITAITDREILKTDMTDWEKSPLLTVKNFNKYQRRQGKTLTINSIYRKLLKRSMLEGTDSHI